MGFEVGDNVRYVGKSEIGTITSTTNTARNKPLVAEFPCGDVLYFELDGRKFTNDDLPSLFQAEGYQPPLGGREPIRFKKGDPVLVSNSGGDYHHWKARVFSDTFIGEDGKPRYRTISAPNFDYNVWQHCAKFELDGDGEVVINEPVYPISDS